MAPNSQENVGLGSAVRELRAANGLTQQELGLKAALDRTYLGGVERGERNPSFECLLKIAAALEVSLSELIAHGERLTDQ